MQRSVIFIHGMFNTGKCWETWLPGFERQGYRCLAADWPLHAGEPAALRAHVPPGLGDLSLTTVVEHFAALAAAEEQKPVLVGHSVGGLVVQLLASRGLAEAGVCISSVAPNRMLTLDWDFFRTSAAITNPLKGSEPYEMTEDDFHQRFANTLSKEESALVYAEQVVHDSRNVLRGCMGSAGEIDVDQPHVPLLFIAGDQDKIIPEKLPEKNARAWRHAGSVTDFKEFPGRSHCICGEPGWQEVAAYVERWLLRHAPAQPQTGVS